MTLSDDIRRWVEDLAEGRFSADPDAEARVSGCELNWAGLTVQAFMERAEALGLFCRYDGLSHVVHLRRRPFPEEEVRAREESCEN